MKNQYHTHTQIITLLSCLFVVVTPALMVAASAPPPDVLIAAAVAADDSETTVTGKVAAKDDGSLQVNGNAVLVTDSTVYVRNGVSATLADVQLGDEVRVSCVKGAGGSLVAIRVEVTTPAG